MGRKYVKQIRQSYYTAAAHGMMMMQNEEGGVIVYNYDNPDVLVRRKEG